MSIILKASVICDGCQIVINPERVVTQNEIDIIRWTTMRKNGVTAVERVRRSTKFFCAACADKPQK